MSRIRGLVERVAGGLRTAAGPVLQVVIPESSQEACVLVGMLLLAGRVPRHGQPLRPRSQLAPLLVPGTLYVLDRPRAQPREARLMGILTPALAVAAAALPGTTTGTSRAASARRPASRSRWTRP
jgi:hypothetical protein